MSLYFEHDRGFTPDEDSHEIVERKGLGHPDTICDLVMERLSVALCAAYRQRFGTILHHNCDKGLLVAGQVERAFRGGRVLEPMRVVFGDRASDGIGSERIDVAEIAVETAKAWFRERIRRVDVESHLRYQVELRGGSEQLRGIFGSSSGVLGANDTSAAVGFAPLTETEEVVLEAERHLNSRAFKDRFPDTGEDVKVLGVRRDRRLELTVAMPFIQGAIVSEAAYFERKEAAARALEEHLLARLVQLDGLELRLNALDRRGAGTAGVYLSLLGTSAEDADSGQVGRGNQVHGLISLNRPRGGEATAGKNPVSHVGKIYSVLSHLLARRIHAAIPGVTAATVWLASRIGDRIDRPAARAIRVRLAPGASLDEVERGVRSCVDEALEGMPRLCEELVRGEHSVC